MTLYHTDGFEPSPQLRQHFALEPGVPLHPEPVARTGVGQGKEFGQVLVARAHGFGEGFFPARAEIVGLRVAAEEQREPDGGQVRAQFRMPLRRAFGPRRKVARFARPRVAQARRNDGDAALVVEILARDAQPFAQQIARRVVPGNAALVHAPAGRLPHDEEARSTGLGGLGRWPSQILHARTSVSRRSNWAGFTRVIKSVLFAIRAPLMPPHSPLSPLNALSPLDGRYHKQLGPLRACFSETALFRYRIAVEIRWLLALAAEPAIGEIKPFSRATRSELERIIETFSEEDAVQVKAVEAETHHDVKAIEYWLKRRLAGNPEGARVAEFVHFACTSEDINNLAYGLMLKEGRDRVLLPALDRVIAALAALAVKL